MHSKKETCIYSPENAISGDSSLSLGKKIRITNKSMKCALGEANCSLHAGLTSKDEYTPEERAKMGKYGTESGPAKTARHFSAASDSKIS